MGRVKSLMIKRVANELMDETVEFSDSFETNKKLLKNAFQYKSTRNKIAGYMARLVKKQKLKQDTPRTMTE
ncbi:30S ribosomal protein S17e [Candidatus Pacearchaeota archaeon]|nr:30S ribosomal protein S17e [Candidatus Pacearchaeota archaeon]